MGQKIGHRQERKPRNPRNHAARDMILNKVGKGGPHADKREKRIKNPKNDWENDWDSEF